jgi:hypothetical protein
MVPGFPGVVFGDGWDCASKFPHKSAVTENASRIRFITVSFKRRNLAPGGEAPARAYL